MAFFELPAGERVPAESRQILDEYQRLVGHDQWNPVWHTYAELPGVLAARLAAFKNLHLAVNVPPETKNIAIMLIAHARRCQACFSGARRNLARLGFDEPALDGFCANPSTLPLKERDRLFVQYTLKIATASADLTPKDLREMEAAGFSRLEIQQMIAFAGYWVFNTLLSQSATAGLVDD